HKCGSLPPMATPKIVALRPQEEEAEPWAPLWAAFIDELEYAGASVATRSTYSDSAKAFTVWCQGEGQPTAPAGIDREQIKAFLLHLQRKGAKPATVRVRYSTLHKFFGYLVDEDIIQHSPMERMSPPKVPEQAPEILTHEETTRLIKACG